jgi:hypothetical protein
MWLASVKEALGYIPFKLDFLSIRCLVILKEEENKKSVKDTRDMREETRSSGNSSRGRSVGLDQAILHK